MHAHSQSIFWRRKGFSISTHAKVVCCMIFGAGVTSSIWSIWITVNVVVRFQVRDEHDRTHVDKVLQSHANQKECLFEQMPLLLHRESCKLLQLNFSIHVLLDKS
eukprot:Pompholyxophrys_punicea_v1_NODE_321_length_2256_cov_7.715129.p3 type:complete len:105 gc:universal NODE_321_length_2256_cov_7.715129:535-849(+)